MTKLKLITALIFFLFITSTQAQFEFQTCIETSRNPWEWPGHNNWFLAPGTSPSTIYHQSTGVATTVGSGTNQITGYEGISSASNDKGELVLFTNGRRLWDKNAIKTYDGLKEGNEGLMINGSASQGVITVRHPLKPYDFYIFTVDDIANGPMEGFNYAVIDTNGQVIQNSTRLGSGNTCEGITATFHANQVDLWLTYKAYSSPDFYSYLLTCDGVDPTPVISSVGHPVVGDKARGGLAYNWDGTKLAAAFGEGWPNTSKQVILYDFDNETGIINNPKEIAGNAGVVAAYDCIFSADNSELYVSSYTGNFLRWDVSSNNTTVMANSFVNEFSPSGGHTSMDMGADGNVYFASLADGLQRRNPGGGSCTALGINTSLGMPTMYIPPAEEPDIQEVGPFCDTAQIIDLSTYWVCNGLSAEDTVGGKPIGQQRHLYSGPGIVDDKMGHFNPKVAGQGTHEIIFDFCDVNDTIYIEVVYCPVCQVDVKEDIPEICVGETLRLDTFTLEANGIRLWNIDSSPNTANQNPVITTVGDTIFDASDLGTHFGTYKLSLRNIKASDTCYDYLYIKVNELPKPDLGIDSTICKGDAPITFDAGNWNAYNWNFNNETTQTISTGTIGEYTVEVTDGNGCKGTDAVWLYHDTLPKPNLGPDNSICLNDPMVTFSAGNWSEYSWTPNGETTKTIKYNTQGFYGIEVTDGNGCKGTDSLYLTVNTLPTVDLGADQEICKNDPKVTFDAQNIGSQYKWFGLSETTQTILTDSAGIYSVEITDINGCKDTDQVVLTVHNLPIANLGADTAICFDASPVTFDALNIGSDYLWQPNGETSKTITTNLAGEYILEVTNINGCKDTDSVVLVINALPLIDIGSDQEICQIHPKINIDAGHPTATFLWSTSETTQVISTKIQNNYSVIVTDTNGCLGYDTMNLTVNPMPVVNIYDQEICIGDAAVTFDVGALFVSYDWNKMGPGTSQTHITDVAGEHTVIFTDANGCVGHDTALLIVHPLPIPNLGSDITICSSEPPVTFDAGSYSSYLWSSGETSQTISKDVSGIFEIEVTDVNGCKNTDKIELFVITNPSPDVIGDDTKCPSANHTFDVFAFNNGNGPYTYLWQNGSTGSSYSTTIPVGNSENVWVDITDNFGCTGRDLGSITDNPDLTVNINASPDINLCDGESALLVPNYKSSNGYFFQWSGDGSGTNENITVDKSGIYNLHVDNGGGCEGDGSIEIFVHPNPVVTPGSGQACDGQAVIIGDDQGNNFNYTWSNGETTPKISVFSSNNLTQTLTNKTTGCFGSANFTSTIHPNPTPILANPTACSGETLTLEDLSGQSNASQTWSNGETTPSINPTSSGTYTLTVTSADNCNGTAQSQVYFIPIPTVDLGPDIVLCQGETAIIDASNTNLNVSWNTGQTTSIINVNQSGNYIATVSDNGCIITDEVLVSVLAYPTSKLNQALAIEPICFEEPGTIINLDAGSNLAYNYLWSTEDTTSSIDIFKEGTYLVEISVGNCSITDDITFKAYCPSTIYVPNAFTPDQDNINDEFNAKGNNIEDYQMFIYDRWGELIFHSKSLSDNWDGTYMNNKCQVDVYVWRIYYSVESIDNNKYRIKKQKTGIVSLLR